MEFWCEAREKIREVQESTIRKELRSLKTKRLKQKESLSVRLKMNNPAAELRGIRPGEIKTRC